MSDSLLVKGSELLQAAFSSSSSSCSISSFPPKLRKHDEQHDDESMKRSSFLFGFLGCRILGEGNSKRKKT